MRELVKVLMQRHTRIRRPCVIKVLMVLRRASFSAPGRTKTPFWPQNQDFKNIGEYWITPSRTIKRNNTGKVFCPPPHPVGGGGAGPAMEGGAVQKSMPEKVEKESVY